MSNVNLRTGLSRTSQRVGWCGNYAGRTLALHVVLDLQGIVLGFSAVVNTNQFLRLVYGSPPETGFALCQ